MVLIATLLLAVHVALGLVFDPRYKDFPFAPLTAAIVPLLTLSLATEPGAGRRGAAELAAAGLLALSVVYIVPDEGLANWQSLWLCAALAGLALTSDSGARRARLSSSKPAASDARPRL